MKPEVGVIGAGHMGRRHVRVCRTLGVLTAVFDTDPSRCEVAEEYNAPFFNDLASFDDDLDAVVIAVPPEHHYNVAMNAIDRGISVFVEKPLTLDPALGRDLVTTASDAGVTMAVGHVERFNPAYMWMKDHVADPDFVFTDRASGIPNREVGPALYDIGVHDLDLVSDLHDDDPEAIESCITDNGEIGVIRLRFPSGEAVVRFNRMSRNPIREVTSMAPGALVTADIMNKCVYTHDGVIRDIEGMEPIEAELRDFLSSIGKGKPIVCGDTGLRAVRLAHAAENYNGRGWTKLEDI